MSEQRVCLVHYHEIGLKGKNRAHFEKQLITNIKAVLGDAPVARIKRISGRICLFEEEGATYEQSCELVDLRDLQSPSAAQSHRFRDRFHAAQSAGGCGALSFVPR